MKENEINLIKEIYDFLEKNNFNLLKKNVLEIEKNNLKLPFKSILKDESLSKKISNAIEFLCISRYPFGLLAYKAEKDEEKQLLLNQKKTLKSQISITLQETTNRDVKKILEIFSRSLWKILRA